MANSIEKWLSRVDEKSGIIERGEIDKHVYFILKSPGFDSGLSGYNGYVMFPKRPTVETSYHGILTYVPVHGGITFAKEYDEGMVYGFDTGHYDSEQFPRTNTEWIRKQIKLMLQGIEKAAEVEKKYLTAKKNTTRAKYAQIVLDIDSEHQNAHSFGVNINLLSGQI